jgi:DNA polymerase-3 subunit alpha
MSDFANQTPVAEPEQPRENRIHQGTLYLRLPSEDQKLYPKIKAILNMFPGDSGVVLFFEDTRQRRGTRCVIMDSMLKELKNVLGEANVVLK